MRQNSFISAITLFLLLLTSVSFAADSTDQYRGKVTFKGPNGEMMSGVRCGVVDVSPTLEVLKGMREAARSKTLAIAANISIPVAFHVITNSQGDGNVPLSQINASIDVLNAAYNEHGFFFNLLSVDTTANNNWYTAGPDSIAEQNMKASLAIDPANTFNVYTSNPGGGLLGWATFPWYYPESDTQHGVVILYSSVPGGSAIPYNEGDTLTHEAGHYLGLFHTFQGGCRRPGDYLPDTPAERTSTSGCPVNKDTCPWGDVDPIHNFMDYSDDACMYEFTLNQRSFMNWAVNRFKPSLLTP